MKDIPRLAAIGIIMLVLAGCAAPSSDIKNSSPAAISPSLSLDYIQVHISSSVGDLTSEEHSLSDAIISGLYDTGLFQMVSPSSPTNSPVNGIKVVADIKKINTVSDTARTWAGAWAGQAQILVEVTITDLNSGQTIETFEAEGKSGKSAWAGTTDQAIEFAAERIVAEVVNINSRTSQ